MANRSYLYTAKSDYSIIRDVSEFPGDVSLVYKILLGDGFESVDSKLFNFEKPIAICANFKGGIARLNAFYDYLMTQKEIDTNAIKKFKDETKEFFEKNPERLLDIFHMEGGEAYELYASPKHSLEKEHEYNFLHIKQISFQIYEIIKTKPENILNHLEKYKWLADIKNNIDLLNPYWSHVSYYSFNHTGKK